MKNSTKRSPKASANKVATPVSPAPAKPSQKEKLKANLESNAVFMRGIGWTFGILGLIASLPFISSFVEAFVWPIVKLPFWFLGLASWPFGYGGALTNAFTSLIFGTATTPGIPVAFVQGLLPPFMAPAAIWLVIGVPLALLAYQYAYVNWNESLFAPKPPLLTGDEELDKDNPIVRDRKRAEGKTDAAQPDTPKEQQQPPAEPADASKDAEVPKKRASQKGSADAIVPGLNQKRAQDKAAKAKVVEVEAPKPATKRKARKK